VYVCVCVYDGVGSKRRLLRMVLSGGNLVE
jgi:hypothetical protein